MNAVAFRPMWQLIRVEDGSVTVLTVGDRSEHVREFLHENDGAIVVFRPLRVSVPPRDEF